MLGVADFPGQEQSAATDVLHADDGAVFPVRDCLHDGPLPQGSQAFPVHDTARVVRRRSSIPLLSLPGMDPRAYSRGDVRFQGGVRVFFPEGYGKGAVDGFFGCMRYWANCVVATKVINTIDAYTKVLNVVSGNSSNSRPPRSRTSHRRSSVRSPCVRVARLQCCTATVSLAKLHRNTGAWTAA